jgi:hypothetical protein
MRASSPPEIASVLTPGKNGCTARATPGSTQSQTKRSAAGYSRARPEPGTSPGSQPFTVDGARPDAEAHTERRRSSS